MDHDKIPDTQRIILQWFQITYGDRLSCVEYYTSLHMRLCCDNVVLQVQITDKLINLRIGSPYMCAYNFNVELSDPDLFQKLLTNISLVQSGNW